MPANCTSLRRRSSRGCNRVTRAGQTMVPSDVARLIQERGVFKNAVQTEAEPDSPEETPERSRIPEFRDDPFRITVATEFEWPPAELPHRNAAVSHAPYSR